MRTRHVHISARQFNHEMIQSISIHESSNNFLNQHGYLFIRSGPNRLQKAVLSLTLMNLSGQTGVCVWLSPSAPNLRGQLSADVQWPFKTFRHEALPTWSSSDMNTMDFHLQTRYPPNMKTFKPSNMKPSNMKPFKNEDLQTWCPPNNSLNLFWSARPIDLVHPVKWTKIAMSN